MIWFVTGAWAAEIGSVKPPITEIDHPRYVDAAGRPLSWSDVKMLSASTDAIPKVQRRRVGRTLVRVMFAGATAVEVWGTMELARREQWTAVPLGAQAGLTGLCAVLAWTSSPKDRVEDRAIVLNGANTAAARR